MLSVLTNVTDRQTDRRTDGRQAMAWPLHCYSNMER